MGWCGQEEEERFQERLATKMTEELARSKDAMAAQALQQQEFERCMEAQCSARCLEEAEQLRAGLLSSKHRYSVQKG